MGRPDVLAQRARLDLLAGYDVFRIEPCVYYGAAVGMTAAAAGLDTRWATASTARRSRRHPYLVKARAGARAAPSAPLCPACGSVPASSCWPAAFTTAEPGSSTTLENDEGGWSYLPMALTSLCITVEIATIGYHIGRKIDRDNALKAQKKRQPAGR